MPQLIRRRGETAEILRLQKAAVHATGIGNRCFRSIELFREPCVEAHLFYVREIGRCADIGPCTLEALAGHEPERHPVAPQRQQAEGDAARQLTKKCRVVQADIPINELRIAIGAQHAVTKRKVTINVVRWIGHHYEMNARRKRISRHCLRARNERRIVKRCPDVAGYDQRRARRQ